VRSAPPHGPLAALARGGHHVGPVGGGGEARDLGIDLRAARLCAVQRLQHHHRAAAGDDEPVAVGVEGAGGALGRVVELRRHRPHRVEEAGERPVQFLAAAREHHVLLAQRHLLRAMPMQCSEVEQAEVMEKFIPLIR
jgi:hypothetical protein